MPKLLRVRRWTARAAVVLVAGFAVTAVTPTLASAATTPRCVPARVVDGVTINLCLSATLERVHATAHLLTNSDWKPAQADLQFLRIDLFASDGRHAPGPTLTCGRDCAADLVDLPTTERYTASAFEHLIFHDPDGAHVLDRPSPPVSISGDFP